MSDDASLPAHLAPRLAPPHGAVRGMRRHELASKPSRRRRLGDMPSNHFNSGMVYAQKNCVYQIGTGTGVSKKESGLPIYMCYRKSSNSRVLRHHDVRAGPCHTAQAPLGKSPCSLSLSLSHSLIPPTPRNLWSSVLWLQPIQVHQHLNDPSHLGGFFGSSENPRWALGRNLLQIHRSDPSILMEPEDARAPR